MIFTRLHSSDTIRINKIEIIKPKINKYYEYFYPDGITKGFWKYQRTYFCREILRDNYYETPEEALNKDEDFIKDGQIYKKGILKIFIQGENKEIEFYFKNDSELKLFLESLEFKYSIPLNDFVCFQTKELETLYEYKDKIS